MTTAQLTNYAQHANQTVTVSSTAELQAAIAQLDTSGGGTILVDGNAGPYTMKALQVGGTDSPIKITSLDTNNPAQFTQIDIDQSSHLQLTGIHVEDPAVNSPSLGINTGFDLRVYYSNNIEIANITMDGGATQFFDPSAGVNPGMKAVKFDNVQDSIFIDSTLHGHLDAVELIKVSGVTISGNDISGTQGDGIRGGGWQNVDITDNHIHDLFDAEYSVYHGDMIQLWSTWPHNYQNVDIEISGNIIDAGNGAGTQSILLQAEAFTNPSHPNYQVYNVDVRVHDNIIYNGHFHGITISNTQNAQVYNNTVLWNDDATFDHGQGTTTQPPTIRLTNSPNSTVQDNVAQQILVNGSLDHGDNYYLDYTNPNDPHYAYNHVPGITNGGNATLADLQFNSAAIDGSYGSPTFSWSGATTNSAAGASLTPPTTTPTPQTTVVTNNANNNNDDTAPPDTGDGTNGFTSLLDPASGVPAFGSGEDADASDGPSDAGGSSERSSEAQTEGTIETASTARISRPEDDGDEFFLLKLLKALFGGGGDDSSSAPIAANSTAAPSNTLLSDVVPIVRSLPENETDGQDQNDGEDDDVPFAA